MSILIVIILTFLFGLIIRYLTRKNKYFQFNITPLFIGGFISCLSYFVFNLQYFSLDLLISSQDDWTGGMVVMILQDGIITAILYSSFVFIVTDQIFLRQKTMRMELKYLIIGILTVGVFIFIISNEVSEFCTFNFSPTFWEYN